MYKVKCMYDTRASDNVNVCISLKHKADGKFSISALAICKYIKYVDERCSHITLMTTVHIVHVYNFNSFIAISKLQVQYIQKRNNLIETYEANVLRLEYYVASSCKVVHNASL